MDFKLPKNVEFILNKLNKCGYESKKLPLVFKEEKLNQKKTDIKSNTSKRKPRHKAKKK